MHNESNYKEVIARLEGIKELMLTKFEENQDCHETLIKRIDTANGRTAKNEDRIGVLENWRWYIIGIGSIIIVVVNYLIDKNT